MSETEAKIEVNEEAAEKPVAPTKECAKTDCNCNNTSTDGIAAQSEAQESTEEASTPTE